MANEDFFESILSFSISFYILRQSIAYPLEIKKIIAERSEKVREKFPLLTSHNWTQLRIIPFDDAINKEEKNFVCIVAPRSCSRTILLLAHSR